MEFFNFSSRDTWSTHKVHLYVSQMIPLVGGGGIKHFVDFHMLR